MQTSEALLRHVLEHSEEYEKSVNDYGAVLQTTLRMSFGAPESLLPFPKDEMKRVITSYVICLYLTKQLNPASLDLMKAGYIRLASFLSAPKARNAAVAAEFFERATTDITTEENAIELAKKITSPEIASALEEQQQIALETNKLAEEFDSFLENMKIVPNASSDQARQS